VLGLHAEPEPEDDGLEGVDGFESIENPDDDGDLSTWFGPSALEASSAHTPKRPFRGFIKLAKAAVAAEDAESARYQTDMSESEQSAKKEIDGDSHSQQGPSRTGGFVTWLLKFNPTEFLYSDKRDFGESAQDGMGPIRDATDQELYSDKFSPSTVTLAPRIVRVEGFLRSCIKNDYFADTCVERDFNEYALTTSARSVLAGSWRIRLVLIGWFVTFFCLFLIFTVSLDVDKNPSIPVVLWLIMNATIICLTVLFDREVNKNLASGVMAGKDSNFYLTALSIAIVFFKVVLEITRERMQEPEKRQEFAAFILELNDELGTTTRTNPYWIFTCVLFIYGFLVPTLFFYMLTHVEARLSKIHLSLHWIVLVVTCLQRKAAADDSRGLNFYADARLTFDLPHFLMFCWCMHAIDVRDQNLREVFSLLWVNYDDKYSQRADVSRSRIQISVEQNDEVNLLLEKLQQ
jgi:hypothetical protein